MEVSVKKHVASKHFELSTKMGKYPRYAAASVSTLGLFAHFPQICIRSPANITSLVRACTVLNPRAPISHAPALLKQPELDLPDNKHLEQILILTGSQYSPAVVFCIACSVDLILFYTLIFNTESEDS